MTAARLKQSPRAAATRDTSQGTGAGRQLSRDDRAATHDHPLVETLRYRAIMAGLPLLRALHRARA